MLYVISITVTQRNGKNKNCKYSKQIRREKGNLRDKHFKANKPFVRFNKKMEREWKRWREMKRKSNKKTPKTKRRATSTIDASAERKGPHIITYFSLRSYVDIYNNVLRCGMRYDSTQKIPKTAGYVFHVHETFKIWFDFFHQKVIGNWKSHKSHLNTQLNLLIFFFWYEKRLTEEGFKFHHLMLSYSNNVSNWKWWLK